MLLTIIRLVGVLFVTLVVIVVIGLWWRQRLTQLDGRYQIFLGGKVPAEMPDGFYRGAAAGGQTPWQGKEFDAAAATGINVFTTNNQTNKSYPFHTSVSKSLVNKDLSVINIDYNTSQNPLWLRPVLDEIVEVAPKKYLGRLTVRLPFSTSIALGYFELEQIPE